MLEAELAAAEVLEVALELSELAWLDAKELREDSRDEIEEARDETAELADKPVPVMEVKPGDAAEEIEDSAELALL